jgi:hypothetical protein
MESYKQIKNYTYQEKKKINDKIDRFKKIGKKEDFIVIGKLIKKSLKNSEITEKSNGIWFDLTLVDDATIYKIDKYLKQFFKEFDEMSIDSDSIDNIYIPYYYDKTIIRSRIGPKFSKKETNLINKFRNDVNNKIDKNIQTK